MQRDAQEFRRLAKRQSEELKQAIKEARKAGHPKYP
jgi:hypothetical protein